MITEKLPNKNKEIELPKKKKEIEFTDNQKEAIAVNEGNYLIAAAAGSGKTAVLSNRVVRLLTEGKGVLVDELVVLTYTNLSTFEMKERISDILTEKILDEKSELSKINDENEKKLKIEKIKFYELQKLKLPNSRISTIDSLCSNLVKENFQKLGISGNMRTATGVELDLIKSQVLDDVLSSYYDKEDNGDFLELVENFSKKDDSSLKTMLLDSYKFIRYCPYPISYLEEVLKIYETNDITMYSGTDITVDLIKSNLDKCIELHEKGLDVAEDCEVTAEKYGIPMEAECGEFKNVRAELELKNYSKAMEMLSNIKFAAASGVSQADVAIRELCKSYRDESKSIITKLCEKYFRVFKEFEEDMKAQSKISKIFIELLIEYYEKLQEKKRELEIMDFTDISFYTIELLSEKNEAGEYVQTSLAKALADGIKYIVVDECQDIDKIQNTIFNLLSTNENNIYMVGDVKQSIYKFRGASPELFIEKKTSEDESNKTKTILLKENFRSRDVVCDIVNHIFKQLMSKEVGDIDYDESEELLCGRVDYFENENAIPELHIIDVNKNEEYKPKEIEAEYVASTIQEMINSGYEVATSNGGSRKCEYKDFAIIARSNIFEPYVEALEKRGITVDCEIQKSFFEDRDVSIMFNLLKIINNTLDDIALTSVLMSPLFGFSADLITKIKLNNKHKKMWLNIVMLAKGKDDDADADVVASCKEFLLLIILFKRKSVLLSTTKLLQYVYDKTDFFALMSTQCDVEKIDLNMNLFLNYTKEYEGFSNSGLSGFINYVTKLKDIKKDFDGTTAQINDSNSVKFLTIHKSKGLEFPICFLVNCDKNFNKDDINKKAYLWDNTFGLATKIVDREKLIKYKTLQFETIRAKKEKEIVSEELRVLYVALTRAKEKLIMVGCDLRNITKKTTTTANPEISYKVTYVKDKILKKLVLIDDKIKPNDVLGKENFLDWLIISLLKNAKFSSYKENAKYMVDETVDNKVILRIINSSLIMNKATDEEVTEVNVLDDDQIDEKLVETIKKQIAVEYKNIQLTKTPAKSTVTKLAKANFAKDSKIPIKLNSDLLFNNAKNDDFVQELTPAQRGTILHNFMQYANFENAIADLDNEIETLINNKYLSQIQTDNLDIESIQEFLKSKTYLERMAKEGNTIKREFKFNFFIPANMVNENVSPDDDNKVFVQGIADCLVFAPNGDITILDYKTDAIRSNEKDEDNKSYKERLTEQYKQQMVLYARALNDIFGEGKVVNAYLYSLAIAEEIEVDIK